MSKVVGALMALAILGVLGYYLLPFILLGAMAAFLLYSIWRDERKSK